MFIDNKDLFEDLDNPYNQYLEQHIGNVQRGYEWLKENLPELISEDNYIDEVRYYGELDDIIAQHDESKYNKVPDAETILMVGDGIADYRTARTYDDGDKKAKCIILDPQNKYTGDEPDYKINNLIEVIDILKEM